jgi:hypothetical protein
MTGLRWRRLVAATILRGADEERRVFIDKGATVIYIQADYVEVRGGGTEVQARSGAINNR